MRKSDYSDVNGGANREGGPPFAEKGTKEFASAAPGHGHGGR